MRLVGRFKFMGVEKRSGFRDPSQTFYVLGLGQGLDSIRLYVEAEQYGMYSQIVPYSDVIAELDYNPVAQKNQVRLLSLTEGGSMHEIL